MLEAQKIICSDCNTEFEFTQEEADYFNSMRFDNYPKRCLACRQARKDNRAQGQRQLFNIICSQCGKEAQVIHPKMTLCRDCYLNQ